MADLDPKNPSNWEQQTYHLIIATIHKRLCDPDLSTDDLIKLTKAFAENRRANNTAKARTPNPEPPPQPWTEEQEAEFQQNLNDAVRRIYGLDISNTCQSKTPTLPASSPPHTPCPEFIEPPPEDTDDTEHTTAPTTEFHFAPPRWNPPNPGAACQVPGAMGKHDTRHAPAEGSQLDHQGTPFTQSLPVLTAEGRSIVPAEWGSRSSTRGVSHANTRSPERQQAGCHGQA